MTKCATDNLSSYSRYFFWPSCPLRMTTKRADLAVPRRSSVVRPTCTLASWTSLRPCSTSAPTPVSTPWRGVMTRSSASSLVSKSPSAPWALQGCPTSLGPRLDLGACHHHQGARDHL